jgi:hypothetical protein
MYSKQQKTNALELYKQTGSVTETVRILGYPTRKQLYNWIYEEQHPPRGRKPYPIVDNHPTHPRNPPLNVKLDAIHRCFGPPWGQVVRPAKGASHSGLRTST